MIFFTRCAWWIFRWRGSLNSFASLRVGFLAVARVVFSSLRSELFSRFAWVWYACGDLKAFGHFGSFAHFRFQGLKPISDLRPSAIWGWRPFLELRPFQGLRPFHLPDLNRGACPTQPGRGDSRLVYKNHSSLLRFTSAGKNSTLNIHNYSIITHKWTLKQISNFSLKLLNSCSPAGNRTTTAI